MSVLRLGNRFFLLTALGYVTALLSCAAVVWALSVPFLRAAQAEHLRDVARQQASAAAFLLDERYDRVEQLARAPEVLDLVVGRTEDVSATIDRIGVLTSDDTVRTFVLDYRGLPLLQTRYPRNGASIFADVEFVVNFAAISRVARGASRTGRVALRYNRETQETHILIGVPVRFEGTTEGATIVEKILRTRSALPGDTSLVTPFQERLAADDETAIFAPVPGMPLSVQLGDTTAAAVNPVSQTSMFVSRIALGLSSVLLLPFLTMSYFGAKHLVAPTKALERSRAQLAEQQSQLRRQSDELRELAAVAQLSHDAITVTDRRSAILWTNDAFTLLTGYTQDEVSGSSPLDFLPSSGSDGETVARIRDGLKNGHPTREEILSERKDGQRCWIAISISPIRGESGQVERYAAILSDVTERREVQDALARAQRETQHLAMHDTLTGLPNRRYLDEVLQSEVCESSEPRTLIRVDLDFFKNVNDTHGHAAGDHVLKVVSQALQRHSRGDDLVARVGGDEFVVLLGPGLTTQDANALCERFRKEITKDIFFDGKTCRVGASFGVASAMDGLVCNNRLLIGADAALYISKAQGRNTTTLYTPEVHSDVMNKRRSAVEIERAVERQEFEPYFQVQIDAKTRAFAGLEALVRWRHPEQGILAPAAFLPLAEQLSIVPEIDEITYEKGLRAVQELNAAGFSVPKVSFNVGVKQLENPVLHTIHQRLDVGPTKIAFEVLESVLIEEQSDFFIYRIDLLRELGFQIEVDDFGSGHASIIGLMQLLPDAMKLDQRLIMPLTEDPHAEVTVRSLVEIGQSLGIRITAEGVETQDHADMLTTLGVDTLQGYCFAKPLPVAQLPALLTSIENRAGAA
ncbi:MAG: EAL domain-containing protein [Pseudomonadota bacterium]